MVVTATDRWTRPEAAWEFHETKEFVKTRGEVWNFIPVLDDAICAYTLLRMNERSFAEFEDCICFNLRWVTRLVTQRYDHALGASGLRVTQVPILARLAVGPMNMAGLADWLAMDRTTLVRNLRPLQRAKYVTSAPGTTGRGLELTLTRTGKGALAKAHPLWKKTQQSLSRSLGGGRWKALLSDLESVGEKLAASHN